MDILKSLENERRQELSSSSYNNNEGSLEAIETRLLPKCISRHYKIEDMTTPYSSPQKSSLKLSDILRQNKIQPPVFDSFQVTLVPPHIQKCMNSDWLQNAENQVIPNGKAEMEDNDGDDDDSSFHGDEPDFADEFFRTTLSSTSRKRKRTKQQQQQSVSENSSRLQAIIAAAEQRQQERLQRKQTNTNKAVSSSSSSSDL